MSDGAKKYVRKTDRVTVAIHQMSSHQPAESAENTFKVDFNNYNEKKRLKLKRENGDLVVQPESVLNSKLFFGCQAGDLITEVNNVAYPSVSKRKQAVDDAVKMLWEGRPISLTFQRPKRRWEQLPAASTVRFENPSLGLEIVSGKEADGTMLVVVMNVSGDAKSNKCKPGDLITAVNKRPLSARHSHTDVKNYISTLLSRPLSMTFRRPWRVQLFAPQVKLRCDHHIFPTCMCTTRTDTAYNEYPSYSQNKDLVRVKIHSCIRVADGTKIAYDAKPYVFHVNVPVTTIVKTWFPQGLHYAVWQMPLGSRAVAVVPAQLAYGKDGSDPLDIKPHTDLAFDLERLALPRAAEVAALKKQLAAANKDANKAALAHQLKARLRAREGVLQAELATNVGRVKRKSRKKSRGRHRESSNEHVENKAKPFVIRFDRCPIGNVCFEEGRGACLEIDGIQNVVVQEVNDYAQKLGCHAGDLIKKVNERVVNDVKTAKAILRSNFRNGGTITFERPGEFDLTSGQILTTEGLVVMSVVGSPHCKKGDIITSINDKRSYLELPTGKPINATQSITYRRPWRVRVQLFAPDKVLRCTDHETFPACTCTTSPRPPPRF